MQETMANVRTSSSYDFYTSALLDRGGSTLPGEVSKNKLG